MLEHMEAWKAMEIQVDDLHHWPGLRNIADIATKGKATLGDVGPESEGQKGPIEAIHTWPANRNVKKEFPPEELRQKIYMTHLTGTK